jgi:phage-related protein
MKGGFGMLLSPLKAAGTSIVSFIANLFGVGASSGVAAGGTGAFGAASAGAAGGIGVATGATTGFAASLWAATWPILAVVAGIALVAGGVYLLVKNWGAVSGFFVRLWDGITGAFSAAWDWIKGIIFGVSDWILAAVAVFLPIVGIPALIIKHWDEIKGFFSNLWSNVTAGIKSAWDAMPGFFSNIWSSVTAGITAAWNTITGFFSTIWEGIKGIFSGAWDWIKNLLFGTSDWILGAVALFMPIVGVPALIIKHWDEIKGFFISLWNDPKAAIQGFADWLGGKVEAITAPFRMIGDVVSGVVSKIGGFFKSIAGGGAESGAQLNDAFAKGIQSNADAPASSFGNSLQGVARQMPHSDAPEGPLSEITSSGRALTDTFASGMDEAALQDKAALVFSAAMPEGNAALELPGEKPGPQGSGSQTIHIQNLYLQAEDCQNLLDFVRMIMQAGSRPEEAAV